MNYVTNGGTVTNQDGNAITSEQYQEDAELFTNVTVARLGYKFEGWFTNEALTQQFTATTMPMHDVTVYAKWEANSFRLLFDANGGSVDTGEKLIICDTAFGELPTATRQYYIFDGWFTEAEGGEQVTTTSVMTRTDDLTVYAHWTPDTYELTFNANGGTVSGSNSRTVFCGQAIGSLPTPTRDYYTFKNWNTKSDGSGSEVTGDTAFTSATTIYAQWELNPVSGWVLSSNVPAGAQTVNTKYSFTHRYYTTSGNSTMSGWTKYDTQRTSWSSWSSWSTSNPSNGVRNVESRSVYDHTEYHYYRYRNSSYTGLYTYYNSSAGCTILDEEWFNYELPASSWGSPLKYNGTDNWRNRWVPANYSGNSAVSKTFTRDVNRTEWRYQDPVYTYYFYRDANEESTTRPSGSEYSNIQTWIHYRAK